VTEAELFAAYRVSAGYAAQCACGAWITAPSTADSAEIGRRVRVHNQSTEHNVWMTEAEAVEKLRGHVHVHCSCYGVTA
jgi:hypothetical protein